MKLQQLSGAIMAKAMEDTSFYIYNRLMSLNEVGVTGALRQLGVGLPIATRTGWSTGRCVGHDLHPRHQAQRGRAGAIDVLSEIPESGSTN